MYYNILVENACILRVKRMEQQQNETPDQTAAPNRKLKAAVFAVIAEAVLCVVYAAVLSALISDSNFRVFIAVSVVFYVAVGIAFCRSVSLIRKFTKNQTANEKSGLPEQEEESDDFFS